MLSASDERSSGAFLSSASPVYEINAVGIKKVPSFTNAGEVQSHAVYPLASNVARIPPDGNDDASGSPLTSSSCALVVTAGSFGKFLVINF